MAAADRRLTAARAADDGLVELELDGAPWCRVDPLLLGEVGLDVGDVPTAAQRRRVERHASTRLALERGARHLSRRPRSRHDLEQRLARDVDRVSARAAVERLSTLGLVDDDRFAADVVERRLTTGWGPLRIRHDLETAGLAGDRIDEILVGITPERIAAAETVALGGRSGPQGWRRLVARGFDPETLEDRFGDEASEC